ncbi:hypothetical protein [Stenotrophomonas rhizophila]
MSEWFDSSMLLAGVVVRTTAENAAKSEATWLQTYGQLIGVAIGAVLTGSVALLLAIMNNRSSDRRLKMTQAHDLQRESQRMTRERLEELYEQAGHWTSGLEQFGILGLRLAKGLLSYKQYAGLVGAQGEKSQLQRTRMELLFDVYGSDDARNAAQAVKDAQSAFMKLFHRVELIAQGPEMLQAIVPSRAPADPALYELLNEAAGKVGKKGKELREVISAQVKF